MKKLFITLFLAVQALGFSAFAEQSSVEEMCVLQAESNGITGEEQAEFVSECVEETKALRANASSVDDGAAKAE